MKTFLFLLLGCIIVSLPVSAQEARHYTCYLTSGQIVADGRLDEPEWTLSEWSDDFVDITGKPDLKPRLRTRMKMLRNEEYLYIAAELREPQIWASIRNKDAVIFKDNDFEIFLDPDGNGLNYYEIEVNALGTVWDLMLTKAYDKGGIPLSTWDLKGLKTGIHINGTLNDPGKPDSSWTIEMALPLREIMKGKKPGSRPADGVQWRVNFSRVEWKTLVSGSGYRKMKDAKTGKELPEDNWVWSPMGKISMHIPERWGRLEFSGSDIRPEPVIFYSEKQKKEFRIWSWMGAHDSWSTRQWDSVLAMLKLAGVTGLLTQAGPATLIRMIPLAHKYGIAVEKWFIAMMNNDTDLIRTHPSWFVVSREGKSCITDPAYVGYYRFLCPSNPEVRQYLKTRLDEYIRIPGLDGIHLDYIRYPDVILPRALWSKYGITQDSEYAPYDYCYCKVCREKFRLLHGSDPLITAHPETDSTWRTFRYAQLDSTVKELAAYCHQNKLKISAAVFPGPSIAKQLVRQEWNKWPLDEFMPMLYQNFYFASHDWIRLETLEASGSLGPDIPVYSGLFVPSLPPRDLQEAIIKSIKGGAAGICLFNYESMSPAHWQALRVILRK